jgi:hypothetical protein
MESAIMRKFIIVCIKEPYFIAISVTAGAVSVASAASLRMYFSSERSTVLPIRNVVVGVMIKSTRPLQTQEPLTTAPFLPITADFFRLSTVLKPFQTERKNFFWKKTMNNKKEKRPFRVAFLSHFFESS